MQKFVQKYPLVRKIKCALEFLISIRPKIDSLALYSDFEIRSQKQTLGLSQFEFSKGSLSLLAIPPVGWYCGIKNERTNTKFCEVKFGSCSLFKDSYLLKSINSKNNSLKFKSFQC